MIFVRAHRLPTATWWGCRLNRVWNLTALSILSAGTREANWRSSCMVWDVHVRRLASQSQLGSNPFWSRHVCLYLALFDNGDQSEHVKGRSVHTHTVVCAATAAVSKKSRRQRKRARGVVVSSSRRERKKAANFRARDTVGQIHRSRADTPTRAGRPIGQPSY
jgi:hypothetical protein